MRPLINQEFLLTGIDVQTLCAALSQHFTVSEEAHDEELLVFWDTFDWRLWKAGGTLVERPSPTGGRHLDWCARDGGLRRRVALEDGEVPGMAGDLPEAFAELTPKLSMRCLLPMVRTKVGGSRLRVLDGESKTVARLHLVEARASRDAESPEHPLPTRLRLEPVRGYADEEARVSAVLHESFEPPACRKTLFEAALEALGRQPGDYTSKVKLSLDPAQTALDAACTIHRAMLEAMLVNEPGLRQDHDSEFLHDFRVAIRRTRSALSQIKGVFSDDVLAHFKAEFAWMGQITGPTRDLDVYLLKIPAYRDDLPAAAARDLEPLADFLTQRQRQAHRRLISQLDTARYRDLVETWRRQLENPVPGPAADRPAFDLASERIWKLYRRIRKDGLAIDDESPAEALHEVRIMGKKLRYLMEFFRTLYPAGAVGDAIGELKRLQDNLGDFNDYEVQQVAMQQFAEDLLGAPGPEGRRKEKKGEAPATSKAATLLAMGRLQARLQQGLDLERHRFGQRFARFAAEENHRRFRKLFSRR